MAYFVRIHSSPFIKQSLQLKTHFKTWTVFLILWYGQQAQNVNALKMFLVSSTSMLSLSEKKHFEIQMYHLTLTTTDCVTTHNLLYALSDCRDALSFLYWYTSCSTSSHDFCKYRLSNNYHCWFEYILIYFHCWKRVLTVCNSFRLFLCNITTWQLVAGLT